MAINSWHGIGNVGADPKITETKGGKKVASFSIAINSKKKEADGSRTDQVEWVRITAWDKLAGIIEQYVKKGQSVYIEGRLQTRSYEKDGQTHYATDVVANTMQMLGGKGAAEEEAF